ncbi:MAG: hypothetical protein HS110_04015 [Zoogloeaceae bacterium]|nr:hypothetical protein [Zoogloeaceae bacterium]
MLPNSVHQRINILCRRARCRPCQASGNSPLGIIWYQAFIDKYSATPQRRQALDFVDGKHVGGRWLGEVELRRDGRDEGVQPGFDSVRILDTQKIRLSRVGIDVPAPVVEPIRRHAHMTAAQAADHIVRHKEGARLAQTGEHARIVCAAQLPAQHGRPAEAVEGDERHALAQCGTVLRIGARKVFVRRIFGQAATETLAGEMNLAWREAQRVEAVENRSAVGAPLIPAQSCVGQPVTAIRPVGPGHGDNDFARIGVDENESFKACSSRFRVIEYLPHYVAARKSVEAFVAEIRILVTR